MSGKVRSRAGAALAAVHRDATIEQIAFDRHEPSLDGSVDQYERVAIQSPAFTEWRVRVLFQGARVVDPAERPREICVFFGDAQARTLAPPTRAGELTAVSGALRITSKAIYLRPTATASGAGSVESLMGELQVLPPVGTATITMRLDNRGGTAAVPYRCSIEPFDALEFSRIGPESARHLLRMEELDPQAARTLAEKLPGSSTTDAAILSPMMDLYRRLGDASRLEALAREALELPKADGKLRHKARHILASLQEQDPNWSIHIPGDWSGCRPEVTDRTGGLRVAHLFKTTVPVREHRRRHPLFEHGQVPEADRDGAGGDHAARLPGRRSGRPALGR
jgi:hypothetical protein